MSERQTRGVQQDARIRTYVGEDANPVADCPTCGTPHSHVSRRTARRLARRCCDPDYITKPASAASSHPHGHANAPRVEDLARDAGLQPNSVIQIARDVSEDPERPGRHRHDATLNGRPA